MALVALDLPRTTAQFHTALAAAWNPTPAAKALLRTDDMNRYKHEVSLPVAALLDNQWRDDTMQHVLGMLVELCVGTYQGRSIHPDSMAQTLTTRSDVDQQTGEATVVLVVVCEPKDKQEAGAGSRAV